MHLCGISSVLICILFSRVSCHKYQFSEDFLTCSGTSAHQIEGAWNEDGKTPNTWDTYVHNNQSVIIDGSNADIAADSYHKYKEDARIAKQLGINIYRFSISWARVLPEGFAHNVNELGIQYYENLIMELKKYGIKPMVTLYHWDHPENLEKMGGWTNPMMVEWYTAYADLIFSRLGHLIPFYNTVNEPLMYCLSAYGVSSFKLAPAKGLGDYAPYMCAHNILKAHAAAYRLYDRKYRRTQNGMIGMALDCFAFKPQDPNDPEHVEAAEIASTYHCDWIAHPIWRGDYPELMKRQVAENSAKEGRTVSRLPKFTPKEIKNILGTADFFGLNYYITALVRPKKSGDTPLALMEDAGVTMEMASEQETFEGFGMVLKRINDRYDNPPIFVTENGFGDSGVMNDYNRTRYFESILKELWSAINEHDCNVIGYCFWSLIDNFEWGLGYTKRFGVYHVDFNSPHRERTPKDSASFWKKFTGTHAIPKRTYGTN